jgi:hypothetical protein
MKIMFDEVPELFRQLFRKRWDHVYPNNGWVDTPTCGCLMWEGSDFSVEVAGMWSIVAKKKLKLVVLHTGDGPQCGLQVQEKILVGGQKCTITRVNPIKTETNKRQSAFTLSLAQEYTDGYPDPRVYTQAIKHERNAPSQMKKKFEEHIKAGDCAYWDNSLLTFALLKSSHDLLPAIHPACRLLDQIRNFRNKLCHSSSCAMDTAALDLAVECIQRLAAEYVGDAEAVSLARRISAIRAPAGEAVPSMVHAQLEHWREQARDEMAAAMKTVGGKVDAVSDKLDEFTERSKEHGEELEKKKQVQCALFRFSTVPALPTRCVERGELCALLQRLLPRHGDSSAGGGSIASAGAVAVIGVANRGGAGKTTEVIRAARDPAVQREYCDGVFFLTLGESADPLDKLVELGQALARTVVAIGEKTGTSIDTAKAYLQAALQGKRALLVLDDVWPSSLLAATMLLEVALAGGQVQVLLTTRDAGLVRTMGAEEHQLRELHTAQALAMLGEWAGGKITTDDEHAMNVVQLCGRLPMLLRVAGAMTTGPWASWAHTAKLFVDRKLLIKKLPVGCDHSAASPFCVTPVLSCVFCRLESPVASSHHWRYCQQALTHWVRCCVSSTCYLRWLRRIHGCRTERSRRCGGQRKLKMCARNWRRSRC